MDRRVSLSDPRLLTVTDPVDCHIYCGSDQYWYATKRQRLTGCGPSVAANLLFYMQRKENAACCEATKESLLGLMNEIWSYVTPEFNGIPSTALLQQKLESYAAILSKRFQFRVFNVPKDPIQRQLVDQLVRFLTEGLLDDCPIAFLNLCNGAVDTLEKWHWVTIVDLNYDKDTGTAYATICDEGVCKRIDLGLWLQSTTLGGGFLYFNM